jgi:hypothetical protein
MLARMIPTKTHAGMDYAVGLLLIANAWLPFVVIGLGEIASAATTDPKPEKGSHRRAASSAA